MSNPLKAALFYAMALVMSLAIAILASPYIGELGTLVVMLTPTISVLAMMLIFTREGYTRAGWRDLGLTRLGLKVWPLAFGAPLVVLGLSYGVVWVTGVAQFRMPINVGDLLANAAVNFGIALILCLGEEIGWRGYLLTRLRVYGDVPALLIVGFLQAVWHLPFIVFTSFYHGVGNIWIIIPLFVATLTVAGVFFGYLRIVGASTWPAAIAHSVFNIYWNLFGALTIASSPLAFEYLAGESGVLTLAGVSIASFVLIRRLGKAKPVRDVKSVATGNAETPPPTEALPIAVRG